MLIAIGAMAMSSSEKSKSKSEEGVALFVILFYLDTYN